MTEQPLHGTATSERVLEGLGFRRFELEVISANVPMSTGVGCDWNTPGNIPRGPGVYVFAVDVDEQPRVTYVSMTEHLWMVTKGRLPSGEARGGNRYGRPRHAGITRQRINILAADQIRLGRTVSHWLCPVSESLGHPITRKDLEAIEKKLIRRFSTRRLGWNRR